MMSALILAGGQGRRMGGVDKGLVELDGKPLVAWVRAALDAQGLTFERVFVSANRHAERYAAWGDAVLPDVWPDQPGPLAGMHAGLAACRTPQLLVVPCDVPSLPADLAVRLAAAVTQGGASAAYASSAGRAHPTVCLLSTTLLPGLDARLAQGQRRVFDWLRAIDAVEVDFAAPSFVNLNTPEDVAAWPALPR
jgi:molybdopterin-guanine dinucleotide biosynthesis protein A